MTTHTNEQHACCACTHEPITEPSALWLALGQAIDRRQVAILREELLDAETPTLREALEQTIARRQAAQS